MQLFDGTDYIPSVLSGNLNQLVTSNTLRKSSIVKLVKYKVITANGNGSDKFYLIWLLLIIYCLVIDIVKNVELALICCFFHPHKRIVVIEECKVIDKSGSGMKANGVAEKRRVSEPIETYFDTKVLLFITCIIWWWLPI